jgi:hypothetical protein
MDGGSLSSTASSTQQEGFSLMMSGQWIFFPLFIQLLYSYLHAMATRKQGWPSAAHHLGCLKTDPRLRGDFQDMLN